MHQRKVGPAKPAKQASHAGKTEVRSREEREVPTLQVHKDLHDLLAGENAGYSQDRLLTSKPLGVDAPFCSTIVLSENQEVLSGFDIF